MKIFNLKGENIKFESKKENDVLVDVFLKKSVEDLKKLGIYYNFDGIRKDKDWREYIKCKLKVVMGIESWDCFDEKIKNFYKENILDKFLEEKWYIYIEKDKKKLWNNLELEVYFRPLYNGNSKNNTSLKLSKLEEWEIVNNNDLEFKDFINWFYFYSIWSWAICVLKYRFPFIEKLRLEKEKITKDDIIQINFDKGISPENKKEKILEDVSNFLLTKVDLTQDIQEIEL